MWVLGKNQQCTTNESENVKMKLRGNLYKLTRPLTAKQRSGCVYVENIL